jgi:sec-independent protein translocase protein TatA
MLLEPQNFFLLGFFGGIGMQELIIVAIIVLILFGSRLPSVMRNLGRGVTEFKKGVQGVDDDLPETSTSKKSDEA